jgi:hypothetical protein
VHLERKGWGMAEDYRYRGVFVATVSLVVLGCLGLSVRSAEAVPICVSSVKASLARGSGFRLFRPEAPADGAAF